jgi:hypothetical protein
MEYIQNKVFYHIGHFDVGKQYVIGHQLNPFFDHFNYFGFPGPINLKQTKQLVSEYQLYARERIFEDVRQEMFPTAPSRKSCLWILPPDHLLKRIFFWNNFISRPNRMREIYKLSCTGKIHIADERFLKPRFGYLPTYRTDALQYWAGKFKSPSIIHQEVLFLGTISVINVYSNVSELPRD